MVHLARGRFQFLFSSYNSCALSFSLDVNRIGGTTSPEPEHPLDRTAIGAKAFYCFFRRGDVSTMFLTVHGNSLACPFALYRALVAGPRSVMAAARLSRGRGGRERVERE